MITGSYGHMGKWFYDHMVMARWSYGHTVKWSYDHVIALLYDGLIILLFMVIPSSAHMKSWSHDHVIMLWFDHMVIWAPDHLTIIWSYDSILSCSSEKVGGIASHLGLCVRLKNLKFLKRLPEEFMNDLKNCCQDVSVDPEYVFCKQGGLADDIFVIESGHVAVWIQGRVAR